MTTRAEKLPLKIQLIKTADGSHSLLNVDLQESYHSIHGAIQESLLVFIKNGLEYRVGKNLTRPVRVLEIGFGTGLNALLTLQYTINSEIQIHYSSVEAHPIPWETAQLLNYPERLAQEGLTSFFQQLHVASWTRDEQLTENFILAKMGTSLQDADLPANQFDVIYFDAFSPNKQPELWELPMLRKVEQSMKPDAIFTTYCAQGQFKRNLKSLGLRVEVVPGPVGKKEMVRAEKAG
jgi:tRNA U34 5-methylaminomethyl-2-thiouridine-forming methyltransferase MnmC